MSTVLVFGATGYAGAKITAEALSRGHRVIGVARHVDGLAEGAAVEQGSIFDREFVSRVAAGADQIVVSLPAFPRTEADRPLLEAVPHLIEVAIENSARLSFVGGAGSLHVVEGGPKLVTTPEFPEAALSEALAHAEVLEALQASDERLDWFYVSPGAAFGSWNPGERTGTFRLGGDVLLSDAEGVSTISGDDLAIAYVDEIERHAHPRARFTVSY